MKLNFWLYPPLILLSCQSLHAAQIKKLALGNEHSCVLFEEGTVKCWGGNHFGQLGLGDTRDRGNSPDDLGNSLPYVSLGTERSAKDIAAGAYFTCTILDNDSIKCWGKNLVGQLGLEDRFDRGKNAGEMGDGLPIVKLGKTEPPSAIFAGEDHACVKFQDDRIKCWGGNSDGQLGLGNIRPGYGGDPGSMGDQLPFLSVGKGLGVIQLALGWKNTCALLSDNGVKCWGTGAASIGLEGPNYTFQTGDQLPFLNLAKKTKIIRLLGRGGHSCVRDDSGMLKCWGENSFGQLGLGDVNPRGDLPDSMTNLRSVDVGSLEMESVSIGGTASCSVLLNGAVKCWGENGYGQLGYEDQRNRGGSPSELGDNLPLIDLGRLYSATQVYSSGPHSCAILQDEKAIPSRIKCWGKNSSGQLGTGDSIFHGAFKGTMGDNLPFVRLR